MTSLVADYGSSASESEEQNAESSESSDEGIEDEQSEKQSTEKTDRPKLPVPSFQSTTVLGSSSSVFSNPFREEEAAQSTILERHVKMTTPVSQQTTVNGKQICWNYRYEQALCIKLPFELSCISKPRSRPLQAHSSKKL
ncbi:hypothetical protein V5799_021715 [Amblyomma americanum]|uniref:Uncharacterized protein n=1 Tax=Amblyomma americanum TaxID=6943 RepID=A0AAQ4FMH3_AMBAM